MPNSLVSLLAQATVPTAVPAAHPLDDFYARKRLPLPRIESVAGDNLPEPFRSLLVHSGDMTSTLENFHGGPIHLNVLERQQRGDFYFREVVLALNGKEVPVEFGAIKINLNMFPPAVRRAILQERNPLGQVLTEAGFAFSSRPKAFLRLKADSFMREALSLSGLPVLYGRRNTLLNAAQQPLAEIVEILPPVPEAKT